MIPLIQRENANDACDLIPLVTRHGLVRGLCEKQPNLPKQLMLIEPCLLMRDFGLNRRARWNWMKQWAIPGLPTDCSGANRLETITMSEIFQLQLFHITFFSTILRLQHHRTLRNDI